MKISYKIFPYQIKHMLRYLLIILILPLINSCGLGLGAGDGGGSVNPSTTKTLVSVQVKGSSTQLIPVGASVQFTATAVYSDNTSADVTDIATWSSSNTAVATVNTSGLVQGVSLGNSDIQASYQDDSGSASGTATVTISNSQLTSVAISPATVNIPLKTYQRLTLTGTFTDGSTVDLTTDPNTTWSSSDLTVASIYESGPMLNFPNGLALAVGESLGTTTINVSYKNSQGTVFSSTSPITVNNATIESISIVGDTAMVLGESEIIYAEGHFSDGSDHTLNGLESAVWISSKPLVIKIESHTGLATATTDSSRIGDNSTIAIRYQDPSGNVKSANESFTIVKSGAAWSDEIDSGYIAKSYALAVDSNDNPILLFTDSNSANAVRAVTYVSDSWRAVDPESSTGQISKGGAGSPALTVDHLESHDILYAFYADNTSDNHITAQKLDTANPTWSVLQSDIDNGDAKASMGSLTAALDNTHTPFVGFHEHGKMGSPRLAVMHWMNGDNAFKKYGSDHYADTNGGSNATSLGLAINSFTDVTLGFLRGGASNGYAYTTHNADNNHWQEETISPVPTNAFASTAGFYTESNIYITYEQPSSDNSYTLISLALANGDRHTLTSFSLNTIKLFAQNNLALGESDTDKPVIAYIDASGNVAARYYVDTAPGLTSFLGANPVAISANGNAYNTPKVVIGKNTAWVAYQDSNSQIILKKLVNPFNK